MDVFALREKVVSDYRHYIESFVRINDERIDSFVKQQFETGALWPDAILQLNPAYEPGPTLDELVHRPISSLQNRFAFVGYGEAFWGEEPDSPWWSG